MSNKKRSLPKAKALARGNITSLALGEKHRLMLESLAEGKAAAQRQV